jgi:hypothetical protein
MFEGFYENVWGTFHLRLKSAKVTDTSHEDRVYRSEKYFRAKVVEVNGGHI